MVEYQRPEFYVEEFQANEYVAACTSGDRITGQLECVPGKEFVLYVNGDHDALPTGENGVGGTHNLKENEGGTIYCVGTKEYVFAGTISHEPHVYAGEGYNVTGEYYHLGQETGTGYPGSPKKCSHTTVSGTHHHISNVVYHDHS